MNRIFRNEVQSRFRRIVGGDGVARDAPHEAQAVLASGGAHAVHPAQAPAYHASSREHMDREVHSSHDQHAGHSGRNVSPEVLVDAAAVDPDICLGAHGPALVRLSRFRWADKVALDLRSVLMTLSTIIVAANAQLLRRVQL
jgi:hypothetical protein